MFLNETQRGQQSHALRTNDFSITDTFTGTPPPSTAQLGEDIKYDQHILNKINANPIKFDCSYL